MRMKFFLILLLTCFISIYVRAQDQERYELEQPEEELQNDSATIEHANHVRLKKHYELGDGLLFFIPHGKINITQSLQVLYGANSEDNFTTTSSEFNVRRARFNVSGVVFDKFYFRFRLNLVSDFQSATSGTRAFNGSLQDCYIEYRPTKNQRINFGLRTDYADSREARIEGESLAFIERSELTAAFDPFFDYGIRYRGEFNIGGSNILRPIASITTGEGTAGLQKNYGGFKYGVRIDWLPFGGFSQGGEWYMDDLAFERTPKLVVGVIGSYNNGASSAKGTNGGRYLYGDANQNILLPDYYKWGFDYFFKYRGFYSLGEYIGTKANVPPGIAGSFSLSGSFSPFTGQTPEQIDANVRSQLNIGSGYNVQAGYVIASRWAVGARYTYLQEEPPSAPFANQNRHYSVVATRLLKGYDLKIQTEFGYSEFKQDVQTSTMKGNIYGQVMFTIQL